MLNATDLISQCHINTQYFKRSMFVLSKRAKIGNILAHDRKSIANAWADIQYVSPDGKGILCQAKGCPEAHHWIYDPPLRQGGKQFVGAIRARAGVLYSKTRGSRGRQMVDVKCDACLKPSSAQHMIQVCPCTHGPRVKRHKEVVEFVRSCVEKKGFKTMIEPSIRDSRLGLRKPDLIIYDVKAYVVDATIVSDSASMDAAHEQKTTYYQQPVISRWVKRCTSVSKVEYSAVAANWRSLILSASGAFLRKTLGFSPRQLALLSLKVAEGSAAIHKFFNKW